MTDPRIAEFAAIADPFKNTNQGTWIWDLRDRTFEWISDDLPVCLGLPSGSMDHTPSSWMHLIHEEDLARAIVALDRHLEFSEKYDLIVRYKHADSTDEETRWVWINCKGSARFDEKGKPTIMIGQHTLIDDRVLAAQAASPDVAAMKESGDELLEKMEALVCAVGKMAGAP